MPEITVNPGEFAVYSDASVRGEWVTTFAQRRAPFAPAQAPVYTRKREGPAMGAWIGWLGCEPKTRPTIAGQAFLGHQGTQTAEYCAAILALNAVLAHLKLNNTDASRVVLRVDNKTLAKTLLGEWKTGILTPHRELAEKVGQELRARSIEVVVEEVSETNREHRHADRMSKQAWNQVFFKKEWRPQEHPPEQLLIPKKSSSSTLGDEVILFELP